MIRIALLALAGALLAIAAMAHEGDDARAKWLRSLQTKDGYSCCSEKDCIPVNARISGNHWEIENSGGWLQVPPEAVLHRDNPDGRPIACVVAGRIICFVPNAAI